MIFLILENLHNSLIHCSILEILSLILTRYVFVKHGCPRRKQSWNMAKSLSPIFWPRPTPQGHVMSVKCEEPIDELTVQVWLLYHHPNFKYCTLFVNGTELRTDKRTDGLTNRRTIRLLDAPTDLSGRGHKNPFLNIIKKDAFLILEN